MQCHAIPIVAINSVAALMIAREASVATADSVLIINVAVVDNGSPLLPVSVLTTSPLLVGAVVLVGVDSPDCCVADVVVVLVVLGPGGKQRPYSVLVRTRPIDHVDKPAGSDIVAR